MKLKDLLQELKKYNVELETTISEVKKIDNLIIFYCSDHNVKKEKAKKEF